MLHIIEAAGWPIWPIILCSIIAVGIIGERFYSLRKELVAPHGLLPRVVQEFRQKGVSAEMLSRLSQDSPLGRIFAAAPEPKRQIWYECGHRLVPEAYEDCAKWVAETWQEVRTGAKNVRAGEPRDPAAKAG